MALTIHGMNEMDKMDMDPMDLVDRLDSLFFGMVQKVPKQGIMP